MEYVACIILPGVLSYWNNDQHGRYLEKNIVILWIFLFLGCQSEISRGWKECWHWGQSARLITPKCVLLFFCLWVNKCGQVFFSFQTLSFHLCQSLSWISEYTKSLWLATIPRWSPIIDSFLYITFWLHLCDGHLGTHTLGVKVVFFMISSLDNGPMSNPIVIHQKTAIKGLTWALMYNSRLGET